MDVKDYYKILEVNKKSSADEIKKSYRKLAMKYHPDTNHTPEAEAKFKDIQEAYEVLKDPDKRAKYDRLGSNWNKHRTTGGSSQDFDWSQWASQQQGSRRQGRTMNDFFGQGGTTGGGGFSEFFEKIFGQSGGFQSQQGFRQSPAKGQDVETEVLISLQEAYEGTKRILTVNGKEKLELKFKPGIHDGQTLKLSGKGQPGRAGGPAGDLLVKIKVQEHPFITRENDDLRLESHIDFFTAALGGESDISIFGKKIKTKIPAETQSGKILKFKGLGMPNYDNPAKKGNLFVKLLVDVPTKLTKKEKDRLKEWQEERKTAKQKI